MYCGSVGRSMRIIPDTDLNSLFIYPIMDSKVIERRRMFCVQTPQAFGWM